MGYSFLPRNLYNPYSGTHVPPSKGKKGAKIKGLQRPFSFCRTQVTKNSESPEWKDPTGNAVEAMDIWRTKIRKVEEAAFRTDEVLGRYILKAVTEDLSFNALKMLYEIPCEKDMYYDRYRKFFYILSNS